jgi:hypothetical protein
MKIEGLHHNVVVNGIAGGAEGSWVMYLSTFKKQ